MLGSAVIRRASRTKTPKGARKERASQKIPQLIASSTVNHVFRYTGVVVSRQSVTRAQLLNTMIMNTNGGANNYRILNSIRVNSISIWATALSGLTASVGISQATVTLEWISTYGPSRLISDTSINPAISAVVHSKAPPKSLCGFWSTTGSNESDVMFYITSNQSCIVDVNMTYVIQDDQNQSLVSTSSSGTIGVIYTTYLDGPRSGALLQPVGLPSLN